MSKYLDQDGVSNLIGKVKTALSGKADELMGKVYTKTQLNSMITTPSVTFVTLEAQSGDAQADVFNGVTGASDTIYRVAKWDGSAYATNSYSEYAFDGTDFVLLDVKEYGVDDVPTAGSENLVKSGGVQNAIDQKIDCYSMNLIDPKFCISDKGISKTNGALKANSGGRVTGYIPVNGQNIISNGLFTTTFGGAVYDKDLNLLRILDSTQYIYQDGDAYIRLSISKNTTNARANYGTTLLPYTAYNPIEGYTSFLVAKDDLDVEQCNRKIAATGVLLDKTILSGSWYYTNSSSILISVKEGDKIDIVSNKTYVNTRVNILSSYTSSAPVVTRNKVMPADTEYATTINEGETFVCITTKWQGNDCSPQKIQVNDWLLDIGGDVKNMKLLNDSNDSGIVELDIADGAMTSGSCLSESSSDCFVKAKPVKGKRTLKPFTDKIVVISHDDIPEMDMKGVRKIYNKYGFATTFNFILTPFSSLSNKNEFVTNVKKMINDGNDIGLHAVFGSFFWRNFLFDITPSSGSTYAPSISELRGNNADGTGVNAFGKTVSATTKWSDVGYLNVPSDYSNVNIIDSDPKWFDVTSSYTLYGCSKIVSGLDLDDNTVSKCPLGWLEYWLNHLIDSSYGYSTTDGTVAERFAEDYEVPSGASVSDYYPDSLHLTSGKIVFFDDTSNPNYNNAEYQKVGRFKKGLFKGCASCCNYEVIGLCIEIAKAFAQHYFGLEKFDCMAYHGVSFVNVFWSDNEGTLYADRENTVLATGNTPLYISSIGKKQSVFDIVMGHGIKEIKRWLPDDPTIVEGSVGTYLGQGAFRGDYFSDTSIYDTNTYLALIRENGSTNMDYETFISYAKEHDNWLKWAIEESGNDISGNGTVYMPDYFKNIIMRIVSSIGTGKIPCIGVDSIWNSPSVVAATETLLRFCYENDITVVSPETARRICSKPRAITTNMFPNPGFDRTLLRAVGGTSTSYLCYIPDGWSCVTETNCSISIDDGRRYCRFSTVGNYKCFTRVYGLPPGRYKFTAYMRGDSTKKATLYKKYNRERQSDSPSTIINSANLTGSFTLYSWEFEIETPYRTENIQTTKESLWCNGYENNVAYIMLVFDGAGYVDLSEPKIVPLQ